MRERGAHEQQHEWCWLHGLLAHSRGCEVAVRLSEARFGWREAEQVGVCSACARTWAGCGRAARIAAATRASQADPGRGRASPAVRGATCGDVELCLNEPPHPTAASQRCVRDFCALFVILRFCSL